MAVWPAKNYTASRQKRSTFKPIKLRFNHSAGVSYGFDLGDAEATIVKDLGTLCISRSQSHNQAILNYFPIPGWCDSFTTLAGGMNVPSVNQYQ